MTSNIISETIDQEYPIAGQDNDTQGFRDNFATIKDSLAAAKIEIETLQEDTTKINTANNFSGNDISDANLVATTQEFINNGTAIADKNISFLTGHYQVFTVADDISFNFTDWPEDGRYGAIRVEILANNDSERALTFSSDGGGTMVYDVDFPVPFTAVTDSNHYIIDAWTYDSGNTVFLKYIGTFANV